MSIAETILALLQSHVPTGQALTLGALRKASGLRADQVSAGLRTLRYAGKIEWDRIALMPSQWISSAPAPSLQDAVAAEAQAAGDRRNKARSTGSVVRGASQLPAMRAAMIDGTDLQALAIETPQDAMRALQARWGTVWPRLVAIARAQGERPLPFMVQLLEAMLDACDGDDVREVAA